MKLTAEQSALLRYLVPLATPGVARDGLKQYLAGMILQRDLRGALKQAVGAFVNVDMPAKFAGRVPPPRRPAGAP